MNIHYSYQFKNAHTNFWGYGDLVVENCTGLLRNADDLKKLKDRIRDSDPELIGCTLVILAWNMMLEGGDPNA